MGTVRLELLIDIDGQIWLAVLICRWCFRSAIEDKFWLFFSTWLSCFYFILTQSNVSAGTATSPPPSSFQKPSARFKTGLTQVVSQHNTDFQPPMPRPPLFSTWWMPHVQTFSTWWRPHVQTFSTWWRPHVQTFSTWWRPHVQAFSTWWMPHVQPFSSMNATLKPFPSVNATCTNLLIDECHMYSPFHQWMPRVQDFSLVNALPQPGDPSVYRHQPLLVMPSSR